MTDSDDQLDPSGADPSGLDPATEAHLQSLLRQPAPMPSDVWLRLERAIMEESALRESSVGPEYAPQPVRGRTRRRTAALFGLAAAAVLVVGGTVVSTLDLRDGGQGPAPVAGAAPDSSGIVLASGTDYEPETLAQQVKRTFISWKGKLKEATQAQALPSARAAGMPAMPLMDDMPFMTDVAGFQDCMHKITQVKSPEDIAVLLVDLATMQGMVTAIVVVPAGEMPPTMGVDPAMEQVFVVTPTCSVRARAVVDLDAS